MKAMQLENFEAPDALCVCVETNESELQAGQIAVAIEVAAINPADPLIFEDRYPGPDALPGRVLNVMATDREPD